MNAAHLKHFIDKIFQKIIDFLHNSCTSLAQCFLPVGLRTIILMHCFYAYLAYNLYTLGIFTNVTRSM